MVGSQRTAGLVREFRRRAALTQQQAADLAGLSVAVVRDLEQGRVAAPRPTTLRRLAEALRLSRTDAERLLWSAQPGRQRELRELSVRVLGRLAVTRGGAEVELESTRQRLLLGRLALTPNTAVNHGVLIETVWGARPPANAIDLLRISVSRLRRRLQPARIADQPRTVVPTWGGYRLSVTEHQLDLLRFRQLLERGRRSRREGELDRAYRWYAEAIAIWRGDPLADLAVVRGLPEVLALSQELQAAAVEYAEVATEIGRPDEVLPVLRRVVAADPLYESAYARLLVALAAGGRKATARTTFAALRRRLVEDLGADPAPELVAAHRLAQRGAARVAGPAEVPAYRQLPADLAEFTGRVAALRELRRRLPPHGGAGTAVTIFSIEGMAGVGKTRLAVRFAHQLLAAGRYPDLQLHADLHGHAGPPPADPAELLAAFLVLLGVPREQIPADLPGRAALYRDRLFGKQAMVVLDNAASAEQVAPLLPAGPTNLALVTSRRSLALDGAQVLRLEPFTPPEAQELLYRLAGPARVSDHPAAVARLVRLCGQLPLTVVLAARRLQAHPAWTVAALADRLQAAPDRLSELAAGTGQLRASFDLSYRALDPAEQRMFRLLGLHPGGEVTVAAAAALAGVPPLTARWLLDRLVDEQLAVTSAGDRYQLPELLRCYARNLVRVAEPDPERHAALTRLFDHYLLPAPAGDQ